VAQELDELDHTDDAEDQRQPHVANRPGPQLIDQDEGQNSHADQEIYTGGCRHKPKTSPPGRHRPVDIFPTISFPTVSFPTVSFPTVSSPTWTLYVTAFTGGYSSINPFHSLSSARY